MCPNTMAVPCFAIAAMCRNRGLGSKGTLPWRLKKEMAYFTRITSEATAGKRNAVLMGRRTWESIPTKYRPLANRINVVISRTLTEMPEGHHVVPSFSEALELLRPLVASGEVSQHTSIHGHISALNEHP